MYSSYNRRHTNASSYFNFRDFSVVRVISLTIITALLYLTNPANNFHVTPDSLRSSFSKCASRTPKTKKGRDRDFFGISGDNPYICAMTESYLFMKGDNKRKSKTTETNYGIFSVWTERYRALHLAFLLQDFTICQFGGDTYISPLCNRLATNLCHGLEAFNGKSPFTALRIIHFVKIISYLTSTCYRYGSHSFYRNYPLWQQNPFVPFLSIFRQDYWYRDLLSINLFVYPALDLLERISKIGTSRNTTAKLHFWVGAFVLVVVFGGLSNWLANVDGRHHGMRGSVAACLGYIVAVAPNKIVLDLDWLVEIDFTAGDILFGSLLLSFLSYISGIHRYSIGFLKGWNAGENIVWVIGGLLGSFFGKWQVEKYATWW